jgi:hypothetical protein
VEVWIFHFCTRRTFILAGLQRIAQALRRPLRGRTPLLGSAFRASPSNPALGSCLGLSASRAMRFNASRKRSASTHCVDDFDAVAFVQDVMRVPAFRDDLAIDLDCDLAFGEVRRRKQAADVAAVGQFVGFAVQQDLHEVAVYSRPLHAAVRRRPAERRAS